jgi:hypothetical protein
MLDESAIEAKEEIDSAMNLIIESSSFTATQKESLRKAKKRIKGKVDETIVTLKEKLGRLSNTSGETGKK